MKFSRAVYPLIAVLAASTLALAPSSAGAVGLSSQVALDWNLNAVTAVRAAKTMDEVAPGGTPRGFYQLEGLIYMSYVQAAVYDATMKISHRYQLYHRFSAGAGHASLEAAVIAASYNTLVFYLGDANSILAAKYQAAIGRLPAGKETSRGIAVGEAAAADIEALRAGDGRNAPAPYACPTPTDPLTPGAYLCTPSSIQTLQTPWVASMRPFLLPSASAFRAPAPPALNSATYINDLAEVKAAIDNSPTRPDQRATALFWNLNAIAQLNQTLRDAATQYGMDLVDTVRLLAMGEMVPTDAGIGCWDSKYHYTFWRPVTAIQAGGDSTWTPLVPTPNHPEYPSAHGCLTSALVETLAAAVGTRSFNLTIMGAANPNGSQTTLRTFATVNDVTSQLIDARVWIGFHYRNSVVAGEALGTAAATWALARNFRPANDEGGDS
jgi:PAP2 superfamily